MSSYDPNNSSTGTMWHDPERAMTQARGRLWSDQFGGGFLNRQTVDPQLMNALLSGALGQTQSPAAILAQAGLGQIQGQARGLAAGAQGMSPALAMRQAQQAGQQAGLQMLPQFSAMNADWQKQMMGMAGQMQLNQQSLNDAAAMAREQMLNNLLMTNYTGNMQQQQAQQDRWWNLASGLLSAGGMAGAGALMAPAPAR